MLPSIVILSALLLSCGGGEGEETVLRSVPTAPTVAAPTGSAAPVAEEPPVVVMGKDATPVDDPVTIPELRAAQPILSRLAPKQQELVTAALNLEPGPCRPCMDDGRNLAKCAVDAPAGCDNLGELVGRAVRLAEAGAPLPSVRAVVATAAPWLPEGPGAGQAWPALDRVMVLELWVDLDRGPWQQAAARAHEAYDVLDAEAPGIPGVRVRTLQTWALREESAPAGQETAHRAVAAADLQGQGLPFLEALADEADHGERALQAAAAAVPGLDAARWQADRTGPASTAAVAESQAAALAMGLKSAPSWRVDGYLLNGHRSLDSLLDVGRNEILDHQERIPAPLLPTMPPTDAP
ncbi:MAG: hypothetical protein H6742_05865 [Alphaproteobacteria bacterium]|nr:hypothetical protein [Alphaproteobacteria bacterium]